MARSVKTIRTKNCQNLIIGFQVTVENVGGVFLRHNVYAVLLKCDDNDDYGEG